MGEDCVLTDRQALLVSTIVSAICFCTSVSDRSCVKGVVNRLRVWMRSAVIVSPTGKQ
jgi:hypothetical protein